ncbi:MAG: prepilin-type N-terminal cleavage/methylation domain-containing protein [Desulfobacterales bacterium]|jgi:prepilin-type N-terminal cleavage/methylation domain-containing protein
MKNLLSIDLKPKQVSDAGGLRDRGFSMIELLVALAVSSIIMAAVYSVNAALTKSYTTQNVAADVQQAVRATIDFMAEDIMMAGLLDFRRDYAQDPEISAAGSDNITFTADRNMDGDTGDEFENLTYWLDGEELKQIDNNSGIEETFIDNVVNFEFRYFRENEDDTPTDNDVINGRDLINHFGLGDPLPELDRDDIRTVQISITVEEDAGIDDPVERTYTTQVRCRNAGFF